MTFKDFWEVRDQYRLIDVREVDEFEEVHVVGAENLPLSQIKQGTLPEIDDRAVAVICKMGGRSAMACQIFEQAGLGEFTNVDGGTLAAVEMGEETLA